MPSFRNNAVDPQQISSAFDSIANAFKVTPQEILAGAKSRETMQKVQYLSDAYKLAQDPNSDQGQLDRLASIAGAYAPSQSLTAVDRNNATSLKTNAADNARALQQTQMQQRGETDRTMLAPVGEGATRFVPPSIASMYGVPGQQVGAVKVNEGQNATLPDGRTIAGQAKPMSTDQLNAQTIAGLGDDARRQSAMGSIPVETIIDAVTGRPKIVSRPDAVGQSPAPDSKAQVQNYRTPTGGQGTARLDGGRWVDTQTGEPIPAASVGFGINVQGNKDDTGIGQTAQNDIENKLANVAAVEDTTKAYKALLARDPGSIGIVGAVRGVVQDAAATAREAGNLFGPRVQAFERDLASGKVDPEIASQYRSLIGSGYNPNIPNAKLYELLLASQVAKMMDPNGRISNDRMKQVQDGLGGGGIFSNVEKTNANLDGILALAAGQRKLYQPVAPAAAAIGQGGTAPAAPAARASGDATFVRDASGKLVRAQ